MFLFLPAVDRCKLLPSFAVLKVRHTTTRRCGSTFLPLVPSYWCVSVLSCCCCAHAEIQPFLRPFLVCFIKSTNTNCYLTQWTLYVWWIILLIKATFILLHRYYMTHIYMSSHWKSCRKKFFLNVFSVQTLAGAAPDERILKIKLHMLKEQMLLPWKQIKDSSKSKNR